MAAEADRFVGRASELAELATALDQAAAGAGSVCLITGEGGIGKTRLVEEALARTGGEVRVGWGRAWEAGGAPPYFVWTQAIRSLLRQPDFRSALIERRDLGAILSEIVPELSEAGGGGFPRPPPLEPEHAQFRLFDAVARALFELGGSRVVVLVLDDVHKVDPSSLAMLEFLARCFAGARNPRLRRCGRALAACERRGDRAGGSPPASLRARHRPRPRRQHGRTHRRRLRGRGARGRPRARARRWRAVRARCPRAWFGVRVRARRCGLGEVARRGVGEAGACRRASKRSAPRSRIGAPGRCQTARERSRGAHFHGQGGDRSGARHWRRAHVVRHPAQRDLGHDRLGRSQRTAAAQSRVHRACGATGRAGGGVAGSMRLAFDCFELGDVAGVRAAVANTRRAASGLRHPRHWFAAHALEAIEAARQGRFEDAARAHERASLAARESGDPNAERAAVFQRVWLTRFTGSKEEQLAVTSVALDAMRDITFGAMFGNLLEADQRTRLGLPIDRARLDEAAVAEVLSLGDAAVMAFLASVARATRAATLAQRVAARLSKRARRFVSWGPVCMAVDGPVEYSLMDLARAGGDLDRALAHGEDALAISERDGLLPYVVWSRLALADVLRERREPGDEARANRLVAAAIEEGKRLGMSLLPVAGALPREGADATPREAGKPVVQPSSSAAAVAGVAAGAAQGVPTLAYFSLSRDGEGWRCSCDSRQFSVRDSKGMRWLAMLVGDPGREIHVLELVHEGAAQADNAPADLGDAGELLDTRARAEYTTRLAALDSELDLATRFGDLGRIERLTSERGFLEEELARAFGVGGRPRRASAAQERARVNVQRRLRDAIQRIEEESAEAGRHLKWAIHTGTFCRYAPW